MTSSETWAEKILKFTANDLGRWLIVKRHRHYYSECICDLWYYCISLDLSGWGHKNKNCNIYWDSFIEGFYLHCVSKKADYISFTTASYKYFCYTNHAHRCRYMYTFIPGANHSCTVYMWMYTIISIVSWYNHYNCIIIMHYYNQYKIREWTYV